MQELISIIIPVYNEKKYIQSCLNSIISQTYRNIEIIVVDDGSDAETAAICDYYSSIDNRVIVIHKKNEGLSSARITGLNRSTGSWICFSDHDDILSPVAIENFTKFINKDIDIISAKRLDFTSENTINLSTSFSEDYIVLKGYDAVEKIPADKQETIITPLWGKLYRKTFLQSIDLLKYKNMCPIIFFEDVLMTPIIFYHARKIIFINKVLYYHREVSTSISRSGLISEFYIDQIMSGDILLEFTKEHKLYSFYFYEINEYIKTIIRIWCLISLKDKNREKTIKKQIRFYFKKYYMVYIKNNRITRKMLAIAFSIFPQFVKIGTKVYIFLKKKIQNRKRAIV